MFEKSPVSSVWLIGTVVAHREVREPEVWGMTAYESSVLGQGYVTFDQVRTLSGRLPARQNISFRHCQPGQNNAWWL